MCWMQQLFGELGMTSPAPSTLHIDNQSAISVAKNPEHHGRMKHLDLANHWLRDRVAERKIQVVHLRTAQRTCLQICWQRHWQSLRSGSWGGWWDWLRMVDQGVVWKVINHLSWKGVWSRGCVGRCAQTPYISFDFIFYSMGNVHSVTIYRWFVPSPMYQTTYCWLTTLTFLFLLLNLIGRSYMHIIFTSLLFVFAFLGRFL